MRLTGDGGSLRRGYQPAALLGAWTLTREQRATTVRANVVESDSYWIGQRPLDLRLRVVNRVWAWSDVACTQEGGSVVLVMTTAPEVL